MITRARRIEMPPGYATERSHAGQYRRGFVAKSRLYRTWAYPRMRMRSYHFFGTTGFGCVSGFTTGTAGWESGFCDLRREQRRAAPGQAEHGEAGSAARNRRQHQDSPGVLSGGVTGT